MKRTAKVFNWLGDVINALASIKTSSSVVVMTRLVGCQVVPSKPSIVPLSVALAWQRTSIKHDVIFPVRENAGKLKSPSWAFLVALVI